MIVMQILKWLAIVAAGALAVLPILLAVAVFALLILAENWRYKLSRYRTLQAMKKLNALQSAFSSAISTPTLSNPLMRGFSIPLSRFENALKILEARVEALQHANDVRHGPHARGEWKHLCRDAKRVARRGKQLEYYLEAPDARDGVWPFVEDHSAIYADANFAGKERKSSGLFEARRSRRNFGIGRGALDEDVLPSLEERRAEQLSALAGQPGITVLTPAARVPSARGVYDQTGKVIPFKRPNKLDVRA